MSAMNGHRPSRWPSRQAHVVHSARLAAELLVAAGLASCDEPAPRDDGLAVATYEPTGTGGDGALLSGVAQDLDGCLVVQPDDVEGEAPYVPVLASDDETAREVIGGSTVELRGGDPRRFDERWDYPSTCPASRPFWVVAQPEEDRGRIPQRIPGGMAPAFPPRPSSRGAGVPAADCLTRKAAAPAAPVSPASAVLTRLLDAGMTSTRSTVLGRRTSRAVAPDQDVQDAPPLGVHAEAALALAWRAISTTRYRAAGVPSCRGIDVRPDRLSPCCGSPCCWPTQLDVFADTAGAWAPRGSGRCRLRTAARAISPGAGGGGRRRGSPRGRARARPGPACAAC